MRQHETLTISEGTMAYNGIATLRGWIVTAEDGISWWSIYDSLDAAVAAIIRHYADLA